MALLDRVSVKCVILKGTCNVMALIDCILYTSTRGSVSVTVSIYGWRAGSCNMQAAQGNDKQWSELSSVLTGLRATCYSPSVFMELHAKQPLN